MSKMPPKIMCGILFRSHAKFAAAQSEFTISDGIWFDHHTNALDEDGRKRILNEASTVRHPRPDQAAARRPRFQVERQLFLSPEMVIFGVESTDLQILHVMRAMVYM